ncbi:MAG: alpha/beta fold hydrolase [bacterium]
MTVLLIPLLGLALARAATPVEVTLHAADGTTLLADWWTDGTSGRRAIVIAPGYIAHKDRPAFRSLSNDLAADADVLCLSLRGHGKSSGVWRFGQVEELDVEAGLREARRAHARVGLLAFSLGAAAALQAAACGEARPDALVLVSVPGTLEEIWQRPGVILHLLDGRLSRGTMFDVREAFPLWLHADFRPAAEELRVPVLFVQGTADRLVPERLARRVYELVRGPKRFLAVPGGKHAEQLYLDDPAGFLRPVRAWLSAPAPSLP